MAKLRLAKKLSNHIIRLAKAVKDLLVEKMSRKGGCAFLSVIYFNCIKTSEEFQAFIHQHDRHDITLSNWRNYKKVRALELSRRTNYIDNGEKAEKEAYITHFNLVNFTRLSENEQKLHKWRNCEECSRSHGGAYTLKRSNKLMKLPQTPTSASMEQFRETLNQSISPVTPQECKQFVDKVTQATNNVLKESQTPKTIQHYLKRKANDPSEVTQHAKRTILMVENSKIKEQLRIKDFTALYGSTQSETEYAAHRKANKSKSHVANLNSYTYSTEIVRNQFENNENTQKVNFTELARRAGLKRNGALPLNAGQVSLTMSVIDKLHSAKLSKI